MTGHLMPDRIDDIDVLDAWKIRRDMELEERAKELAEKEKSTAATVDE
jgi:hypothetical protein